MAVWLVAFVSISAQKHLHLGKTPESPASVDDAFSSLSIRMWIWTLMLMVKRIYIFGLGKSPKSSYFFSKKWTSFFICYDCSINKNHDIWWSRCKNSSASGPQITVVVQVIRNYGDANALIIHNPIPTAVALLGRPDNQCKYTQTITEKTTIEFLNLSHPH